MTRSTVEHVPESHASLERQETSIHERIERRTPSDLCSGHAARFRHSGWRADRLRVWESMRRVGTSADRLWNFTQCGKHASVLQSIEDPTRYRIAGSTCHDRFCLPCGKDRSHFIAVNVLAELRDRPARFVTLTMKSTTETLPELISKLNLSQARLRRRVFWKKRVTGGVTFTEVKWVPALKRWNVHAHMIVHGKYLPVGPLGAIWKDITGDSMIVHVKFVPDHRQVVQYVTKYASKPLDPSVLKDPQRLDEAVLALKGKRLCGTFGNWTGVLLTPTPDENAWVNIGSLDSIIERAKSREREAFDVCQALGLVVTLSIPEPTHCRAPPRSKPAVIEQLFFTTFTHGTQFKPAEFI